MSRGVYPGELSHILSKAMTDRFLLWAVLEGASDIVFRADDPPWIQCDGLWLPASREFTLSPAETQLLTNLFSGQDHKAGNVQRGMSADFAYSLPLPGRRGESQRFRVNVTATNTGHYIVMRVLPTVLPRLEDFGLPEDLVRNLYPENGIVIVSGVMGSGKSTLLAGILHSAVLRREAGGLGIGRQILTLEEPIEFDFAGLDAGIRSAPVAQSEIPLHVSDWAGGVRSMTRRKGEMVMVGEARDTETLRAMLQIVEQGVTCFVTVHAKDVPTTLTRIVNSFPEDERASVASLLIANTRLVIHQRLCRRSVTENGVKGFGRVALREYLAFDERVREALYETPFHALIPKIRHFVVTSGHSLAEDAREAFGRGLIGRGQYLAVLHEQEKTEGSFLGPG